MSTIAGLKLIVPTSVAGSGVSVSASGKVTFTAATSVSVNGCFTSSYDNYLIVIRGTASANVGISLRYRLSGTDASGSNYTRQSLQATSTTVNSQRTTATELFVWEDFATQRSGVHFYVYGPALAQPTASRSVAVTDGSSATVRDQASTHSLSTAYDGFSMYPASGDITGALTIYGLAQ